MLVRSTLFWAFCGLDFGAKLKNHDKRGAVRYSNAPTPAPGTGNVVIEAIFCDGRVFRTESDESGVIANIGSTAVNLRG